MDTAQIIGNGGYISKVSPDGGLLTRVPDELEAYAWNAVSANIDAGDTAILVCNDSTSKHLHIVKAYIRTDVAAQVDWHVPAYGTWAGTAITGVPLNRQRSASSTAPATAKADETGNTQGSIILTTYQHVAVNAQTTCSVAQWVDFGGLVVLGYHQSIAADLIDEPGAFECTIWGYFEDNH